MTFYAQQPSEYVTNLFRDHQTPHTWAHDQLVAEAKLSHFLKENGLKPYSLQRDGIIVEFETEDDRNFFLLNFPSFKRI